MKTITLEIRDRLIMIPAIAIKMEPSNEAQRYLMKQTGFIDGHSVILMYMNDQEATTNPYAWPEISRTMGVAHEYIIKHFDQLYDGQVVDVEYILGETNSPVPPEREELGR